MEARNVKRAGTEALSLLGVPLNFHLLRALQDGPQPLSELRKAVEMPPQSTMRLYSRTLVEVGAISRHQEPEFPGRVDFELTEAGRALLGVGDILQEWLKEAPEGPLTLGTPGAKNVFKALVEGWSTSVIRAFASRPLSLTDLNRLIPGISYPSLERRLGGMRLAGLLEHHVQPERPRGIPYKPTLWLRKAMVPIAAAAAWEQTHLPESAPVGRLDIEAALLLMVPIMELPPPITSRCRVAVELPSKSSSTLNLAGILLEIEKGEIVSCTSRLEGAGEVESWATGSPAAWLRRLDGHDGQVEVGGDEKSANAVVEALRAAVHRQNDAVPS
jgi:DNA-binding HxlR family transcriptional regulator